MLTMMKTVVALLLLAVLPATAFSPLPHGKSQSALPVSTPLFDDVSSTVTMQQQPVTVPWDWQSVSDLVFADEDDQRPIILFDGVCNLCNAGVNFALDMDVNANFRFASLQSKVGQSLLLQSGRHHHDMSSLVLVEASGDAHFHSDAILRIASQLDALDHSICVLSKLSLKIIPRPVRDAAYGVVAEHRHLFGEAPSCRMDFDGEFEDRFVQDP